MTGAEFYGSPKLCVGEFLAKAIVNPDFFRVQVLLCCFSSDYSSEYGISMLVRPWNMKRKLHLGFSRSFSDFSKDFVRKFPEKNFSLSFEFLHYLKFSAFSVPQSDV